MDYRPAPSGTPTPPYVAPYETLSYEINCDGLGVFADTLKIDTSGGIIGTTFATTAPGLYIGTVLIPSGTPVLGLMVSCPVRFGSLAPLIANIRDLGLGVFALTVQDPVTGAYLDNWLFLELTIYVKTT